MKTIDQLIEEDYLASTKSRVDQQFADAELAIATSLDIDSSEAIQSQIDLIKHRVVTALYEKGIDGHKQAAVRRVAGGRF